MREVEKKTVAIPELEYVKVIKEPIHGYIPLTELEFQLLQLPPLNRLHNIHQNGFAYLVYPGAKTCRFEHSLGVMNIASEMIYHILRSANKEILEGVFDLNPQSWNEFEHKCREIIQKVRLSALLHDIGHGPYSHVTEPILLKALNEKEIEEAKELFNCREEKEIPVHEYFSYKMIVDEKSKIREIINSSDIKPEDVGELLIKKTSSNQDKSISILRKIISSEIDADRMDFLLRDSHATGVLFGLTDIHRLIINLSIRKLNSSYELAIHERAQMGVEDLLDARFKMHKWVYNHHLVVAINKLAEEAIKSIINCEKLNYQDFHWTNFLTGNIDDSFMYSCLVEYLKDNPESPFRGLLDRRYAPISLLKRPLDYMIFYHKIMKKTRKEMNIGDIDDKIEMYLDMIERGEIKIQLPEELKDLKLFMIKAARSPYKPLTEPVWMYTEKEETIRELTRLSSYTMLINKEWKKFHPYFIAFVISMVVKEQAKKYKERVTNLIVDSLSSLFS